MNSFVEKFKGEVGEYCEKLESALLHLENDRENLQLIDEIFRIMHTMKGSGGMFGFDLLSEVTHDLESLYEIFRSKKHAIDGEVISFTLNSVDVLRNLLVESPSNLEQLLAENVKLETRKQIKRFENSEETAVQSSDSSASNQAKSTQATWFISFVPNPDILRNGTNPLYLIDELNALGECNIQVSFDEIPPLMEIDPESCYVLWTLFIATSKNIDTLRDVFIFVSEQADIQIEKVASRNVIREDAILAAYLNARLNQEKWEEEPTDPGFSNDSIPVADEENMQESAPVSPFAQTTVDSIRVDSKKIDRYMNLVSELITAQSRLELLSAKLADSELETVAETFGKISRQLRDNAFEMSLIPLQSIAVRLKRLIHDLSKSLDKEIDLVTEGLETELDKNIIEKLIEPLLHLIRNAVDHGIESREIRLANGKNVAGIIKMTASTSGSYVVIEIEDDGAGLDLVNIRKKAISKGMITEQSSLTDDEIMQLIFEPGFSTAELVTDVSGRGVGMDVVRRRIHEMRGMIEIASEKAKYTRITIRLPLSLSIIDGLLVKVGDEFYVIPSSVIRKIHFIRSKSLKKGFRQVVEIDDAQIPYLNMHDEFVNSGKAPEEQLIVIVGFDTQLFGLIVDEVIHEYQAVIKPLGRLLSKQDVFSGASILGTGELALVVDTNKMIKKYS